MNNAQNSVSVGATLIGNTGWTMEDAASEAAAARLDARRFGTGAQALVDSVLARHENVDARWPGSEVLEQGGANMTVLETASESGLDMDVFGKACNAGLDVKAFTDALARGLAPVDANSLLSTYEAGELSGMLANFVEAHDEHAECPDAGERALMRLDGDRVNWLS